MFFLLLFLVALIESFSIYDLMAVMPTLNACFMPVAQTFIARLEVQKSSMFPLPRRQYCGFLKLSEQNSA